MESILGCLKILRLLKRVMSCILLPLSRQAHLLKKGHVTSWATSYLALTGVVHTSWLQHSHLLQWHVRRHASVVHTNYALVVQAVGKTALGVVMYTAQGCLHQQ